MVKKENSVIRKTIVYIVIQVVLIFLILGAYITYSYSSVINSEISTINNMVTMYGRELDNKLEGADLLLEQMIYQNDNYNMLKSSRESDRYYAAKKLRDMMIESVTYNQHVDTFVIAESAYNTCIDYSNAPTSYAQRNELRDFTMSQASLGKSKAEWKIGTIGAGTYLYKIYVWQGEAAAAFISISSFLDSEKSGNLENIAIILSDIDSGIAWGHFGDNIEGLIVGSTFDDTGDYHRIGDSYLIEATNFSIQAYANNTNYFSLFKFDMVAILIILVVVVVFTVLMAIHLRKNLILPIYGIQKSMELIQTGDYQLRITEEYQSKEFNLLKNTFNKLMDEIVGLKIQTYEKQICLQETELKCVKLQIRPHFFLNAMTTISSLSQQGKNEEIKLYIDALSKNIRYMFRSGLHTVMLDEEIKHVENYFEMQELKYPGCVFYFVEASPEAREWLVPQMLIHTIIENEYKYAVAMNSLLTILIKAEVIEINGQEYLRIEIEDDGKGYPDETLEEFSNKSLGASKDGSRVGLWSLKRILEIMYERNDLFTIGNVEPHGCKNIFVIPRKPLQEVENQSLVRID